MPAELRPTGSPSMGITGRSNDDLMGSANDSIQQMDYEDEEAGFKVERGGGVFCESSMDSPLELMHREEADYNEECSGHGLQQTQDTGYHTNSLQSTNQDIAGPPSNNVTCYDTLGQPHQQHTNLTAQFGSMPFCCLGDTGVDLEVATAHTSNHGQTVSSDAAQFPPTTSSIPRKVTSLISPNSANFVFSKTSINSARTGKDAQYSESTDMSSNDHVLQRAREALGKLSHSAESPLHPSQGFKPRLINTMGVPVFPWQPGTDGTSEYGGMTMTRPAVFKERITGEDSGREGVLPASEFIRDTLGSPTLHLLGSDPPPPPPEKKILK